MSVYRRTGSRYYVAEAMVHGKRHRAATGETDKRKALAFETRWKAALLDVVDAGIVPMTLLKAVDRYQIEDLRPRQQKPDTARKSDHNLTLIKAYFGDLPVHEITAELIGRWRGDMLVQGLSAATVNRRLAVPSPFRYRNTRSIGPDATIRCPTP